MPWTNRSYPAAMKNLPKAVREKAVEIANALLDETRMDEGIARVQKVFKKKQEAVKVARTKARSSNASLTVQTKKGKVERRVSYNPNKRARKSS